MLRSPYHPRDGPRTTQHQNYSSNTPLLAPTVA